ncbi:hypothetical protein TNCV_915441 [Trichonephila clavipes]|nr:hypothetical protein TNCV_915441 [Trichonephila clavipes]
MGELKGSNMEMNDLRYGVVPVSKYLVNDMLVRSSDYEGLIENSQLLHRPEMTDELFRGGGVGVEESITTC